MSHSWMFQKRFRRHAFGWRSQPAVQRVREAVAEIQRAARRDPALAAEGAVRFLERVSPALERVDSSSGAIGTAVNKAILALVPVISAAPVDVAVRGAWLERLWTAHESDEIPYIEILADYWGDLCASETLASAWADRLKGITAMSLSPDPGIGGYFHGTPACFSALLRARRYEEILTLVEGSRIQWWHYRKWSVRALAAMGKTRTAIEVAERFDRNDSPAAVARACEEILLASGHEDEAYDRYAPEANRKTTHLATFRAVRKKYPGREPAAILQHLVGSTPGEEGKWFAAAKDAGLYATAIELVNRSPCDPRTLARAARDFAGSEPVFAMEAGLAALRWMAEGWGYEITGLDVSSAWSLTMKAATNAGRADEARERARALVGGKGAAAEFVRKIIGPRMESS